MKAKEIIDILLQNAISIREVTADQIVVGSPDREVQKIGVCFKLTVPCIQRAIEAGMDMIVTHEPVFSFEGFREPTNEVDRKRLQLLEASGLVVYRFHDHAHHTDPDYIHAGFIKAVGLEFSHTFPVEQLAIRKYELKEEITLLDLATQIKNKLGLDSLRLIGNKTQRIKTLYLGLGWVGLPQIELLFEPGADLFITGELTEIYECGLVQDSCALGKEKSILALGHYGAEYAGMQLLTETMQGWGLDATYLDCGEVFEYI